MAGSENDKKMELLHRAVGQVEGVAFFQPEAVRDLLLAACEDIDCSVRDLEKQLAAEENCGLDTPPALRATSPVVGEAWERIATSPTAPRNDTGGVPAGDPSGGSADTSPCAGETLSAEYGCKYCKNRKTLTTDGTISFFIDDFGGLAYRTKERTTILVELKFCPMCGRKL